MPDYRIYTIDHTGHILSGSDFSCRTDEEACEQARRLLRATGRVEVWRGTKRVTVEVANTTA